jgi:hypothetical protein
MGQFESKSMEIIDRGGRGSSTAVLDVDDPEGAIARVRFDTRQIPDAENTRSLLFSVYADQLGGAYYAQVGQSEMNLEAAKDHVLTVDIPITIEPPSAADYRTSSAVYKLAVVIQVKDSQGNFMDFADFIDGPTLMIS